MPLVVLEELRSLLFAPGNERAKLERALRAGADGVVFDLEDSVVEAEKEAARAVTAEVLRAPAPCSRLVRVNSTDRHLSADLAALEGVEVDALVLPKATPELVAGFPNDLPPVVALIEGAAGVQRARETAADEAVAALMLGTADLSAELGVEPGMDGETLGFVRAGLVIDSAAAGIRSPFDSVHFRLDDDAGLRKAAARARSLGFGGKACVHPRQVAIVHEVFSVSQSTLRWASEVLEGYEAAVAEGRGAVAINGEMVDLPVAQRARRLLARSSENAR